MLLFSSILNMKPTFTEQQFVDVVIEWNNTSKYSENIIPDVEWNGENYAFFGNDKCWMKIIVYEKKNIIAVRYEKNTSDNVVWDTDYIMNFEEMKMAVRLDRSYKEDVPMFDNGFSTPHFISLLILHGYISDDRNLPVLRDAIGIGEQHASVLGKIVSGKMVYQMPVVYVSRKKGCHFPVDVKWLASRLKGVAHILVQAGKASEAVDLACAGKNPKEGEIGIYLPGKSKLAAVRLYRVPEGCGEKMLDQIVNEVINFSMVHNLSPLYTWYGINSAILYDTIENQKKDRLATESELRLKESEAYDLVDILEEDVSNLKTQNDDLSRRITALECEVGGLRRKLNASDREPVLYSGEEKEAFPGEIRCILIDALRGVSEKMAPDTRRKHILDDIIENNLCEDALKKRQERVKALLKGYKILNASMKQELTDMGFTITEDGKHYKLVYNGDNRYMVTLAKTPSDSRSGSNIASVICRDLL